MSACRVYRPPGVGLKQTMPCQERVKQETNQGPQTIKQVHPKIVYE